MNPYDTVNKKILFCYSDPGGAKPILALAYAISNQNTITIVSDRNYDFVSEFNLEVRHPEIGESSLPNLGHELLITGTSYTSDFELNLIKEANQNGIQTISFVDNWSGFESRFCREGQITYPDVLYVIDEKAKTNAVEFGFTSENVFSIGNPYWDYLKKWRPIESKSFIFNKYNLEESKKTILIAPDPLTNVGGKSRFGFDEVEMLQNLLKLINPEKYNVILKIHPNQNMDTLAEFVNLPWKIITENNYHNHLIFYSDLIISSFSNILIEAELLKSKSIRYLEGFIGKDLFEDKTIDILNINNNISNYIGQ